MDYVAVYSLARTSNMLDPKFLQKFINFAGAGSKLGFCQTE